MNASPQVVRIIQAPCASLPVNFVGGCDGIWISYLRIEMDLSVRTITIPNNYFDFRIPVHLQTISFISELIKFTDFRM